MRLLPLILAVTLAFGCKREEDRRYLAISKIKSASKLSTTETIVDKVILGTQEKRLLGLIKVNKAYFAANTKATITSGIDLSKLRGRDVKIADDRIDLKLPSVEVLNFSYPFSEYKIDSTITRNGFLNKMGVLDHEHFYLLAELDIRNKLERTGIRQTTEQNTRLLVESMLKNLGYKEIYISFYQNEMIQPIPITEDIE